MIVSEKFLTMRHVNKTFGGVHALKDVNFALDCGEIHCLVGQNGSGKSTLIKIIAGVLDADAGSEVEIRGKRMNQSGTPQEILKSGVCVIYQDLSLFPNMTIAENIAFYSSAGNKNVCVDWANIRKTATTALKLMRVHMDIEQPVAALSIADRQLVAIARALAVNAKLIIMDEPTSSLTRKEVNVLFSIIKDLQKQGMTVLFVSHKLDEIIEIAEKITIIRDGVVIVTKPNRDIDDKELSFMISGETIQYLERPEKNMAKPMLTVEGLTCRGQFEDVTFSLGQGEILGIIGLLGSGRTELAMSLFGMNPPTSGSIRIDGKAVRHTNNRVAIQNGIAYVPEDRLLQGLVIDQDVESNIAVTIIKDLLNKIGFMNTRQRRDIANSWIRDLNIKSAAPTIHASAMSGGNQQKIVLAKWLATHPKILILDQPTNGVDVSAKNAIYTIVRNLAEQGMSILLISDEVSEIFYNCSRALIMHKGRICKELELHEMSEQEFGEEVLHVE